jgi:hypothetical protein
VLRHAKEWQVTTSPTTGPRYASLAGAGEYADINPKTIRRLIARGELTGYRLGTRVLRVDLNELDSLFQPIPTANGAGR